MPIYAEFSETLEKSSEASMDILIIVTDSVTYLSELNHILSV